MEDKIKKIGQEIKESLKRVKNSQELEKVRLKYFGRKDGEMTKLLKGLKDLSLDARKTVGLLANQIKKQAEKEIEKVRKNFEKKSLKKVDSDFDITAPVLESYRGRLHPVTEITYLIWEAFKSINFDIYETPEIETEENNFIALNIPPEHPARDMQDTFYINNEYLLKTHCSTIQAIAMKEKKPSIRVINTGKCYRRDSDMTHTPMFNQFDGICVDKNITMANLKYTLEEVMKINEVGMKWSGIEKIEPDGTVIFTEEAVSFLENVLGVYREKMSVSEIEEMAKELALAYKALESE